MSYTIKGKTIGMFSDIHIGLSQDSPMWHEEMLKIANWIRDEYQKLGINDIIIPGDVFHNRSEISVNTISIAKTFFNILKDFRIFISTGNHDCYYKDRSDINSISMFDGWNNIIIVDKDPILLKYKNKTISIVPWGVPIENIPISDICFGHFEIQSFYMNTFKVCEHGMESKNILKKSPFVISGHFHNKDDRSYEKGRILYLGSPYQQNFGDIDQVRGIYTLDLDSNSTVFIENTISPKHFKINFSSLKQNTDIKSLETNISKNIISFIVDEDSTNEKINDLSELFKKLNPLQFRIDYKSSELKNVENSKDSEYTMIDMEETIEDYVNSIDIEHKKEVINYLLETYKTIIK